MKLRVGVKRRGIGHRGSEYSIEEQIDFYIYSESLTDTVKINIIGYLMVDGEKKMPALLNRIEKSSAVDPRDREILITAVDMVDERCHCLTPTDLALLRRNEITINENDSAGFRMIKELYYRKLKRIELRYEKPKEL